MAAQNPFAPIPEPKPGGPPGQSPPALYGRGYEGHPVFGQSPQMTEAAVQSGTNAIAGFGFDPERISLSRTMPAGPAGSVVGGMYTPGNDQIRAGVYEDGEILGGPMTVTHEAVHRGLQQAAEYAGGPKPGTPLHEALNSNHFEETLARTLEHKIGGTEPTEWELKRWPEINSKRVVLTLEALDKLLGSFTDLKTRAPGRKGGPR